MAEALVSGQVALEQLKKGDELWSASLDGLQSYPQRLRRFAQAAEFQSRAWTLADLAGVRWMARPGASKVGLAFELEAPSGRPGPKGLWARFDQAVQRFGAALEGDTVKAVVDSFAGLSAAASEIADALEEQAGQQKTG